MEFKEKLQKIQCELKAPKNLFNSFGKYKYRNAEGICEAVKPMLEKYKLVLILSDEIILVGERYYIKSTVTISAVIVKTSFYFPNIGLTASQIPSAFLYL